MSRVKRSYRIVALCAVLALVGATLVPVGSSAATRGASASHRDSNSVFSHAKLDHTAKPELGTKRAARGPGEVVIQYDNWNPETHFLTGIGFLDAFRAAWGVRFSPTPDQLPFTLTGVDALLLAAQGGGGFDPGDPIAIVVLADASASGSPEGAHIVHREETVVSEDGFFTLSRQVTIAQGDLYIFIVDRRTDPDGTVIFYFGTTDGATDAGRSWVVRAPDLGNVDLAGLSSDDTGAPVAHSFDVENLTDFVEGSDFQPGNFIIRAVGQVAAAGTPVTGGGQQTDAALPAPTATAVSSGTDVILTWPTVIPPSGGEPTTVNEGEPNDDPATAQRLTLPARVEGSDRSSNTGSAGGFCDADGETCDDVEDWYAFELAEARRVTIDLEGFGNNDFDLFFYLAADGVLSERRAVGFSGTGAGVAEHITIGVLQPGTYLVAVSAFDPGVSSNTDYALTVRANPVVTGFNVYGGIGSVTPSAATFIGSAGPGATSFTVASAAPNRVYVVTSVVGSKQSGPSSQDGGGACEGGPTITKVNVTVRKGKATVTVKGLGFVEGTTVLLNGKALTVAARKPRNVRATGSGFTDLSRGDTVSVTVLGGGGCSSATAAVKKPRVPRPR
jgi:hypothetical protein